MILKWARARFTMIFLYFQLFDLSFFYSVRAQIS